MGAFIDRVGQKYHRLTVVSCAGRLGRKEYSWICLCECGKITGPITGSALSCGNSKSCGCLNSENILLRSVEGGLSSHRLFNCYAAARDRCRNPSNPSYSRYGGRGIEFRFNSFQEFLDDIGDSYEEGLTLDRKENDGHYEKGNVRWATMKEQSNNRSSNHKLTYRGETQTLTQWAEYFGVPVPTLWKRVQTKTLDELYP